MDCMFGVNVFDEMLLTVVVYVAEGFDAFNHVFLLELTRVCYS